MVERWARLALGVLVAAAILALVIRLFQNGSEDSITPSSSASNPDITVSPTVAPTPARDIQTGSTIPVEEFGLPFRMARGNLSSRLGISPFSIHLAEIESVRWPDDSLGNPEPGRRYLEKNVPGFRMVLETDTDGRYLYHTSMTRAVFVRDL